ncbi:hypothetical protein G4B88_023115 [Cannabis sativa]|uniref:Laccase n=1 Tax=Cannabis sativa TaxID=3483 RepID=A0A7J6G6E4_CANSA|nr:hypothetical protein G4B88_023115 [Cannabis sativa]
MHFLSDSNETFGDLTPKTYPFAFMLASAGYLLTMFGDSIIHFVTKSNQREAKVEIEEGRRRTPEQAAVNKDDHDHVDLEEVNTAFLKTTSLGDTILLILALCFHSVFEGIAVGIADTKGDAWRNLWTISLHKIFAAVAMGIALLKMLPKRPLLLTVAYSFAFAISSPIGVGIGIAIDATTEGTAADWTYAISMGLACGVFVYVAINHLIAKGFRPESPNYFDTPFFKFLSVLSGVGVIAVSVCGQEIMGVPSPLQSSPHMVVFSFVIIISSIWAFPMAAAITRHYNFNITLKNVTRLCHTKSIITVNGEFPGPPIIAREGDRLLIKTLGPGLGSRLGPGPEPETWVPPGPEPGTLDPESDQRPRPETQTRSRSGTRTGTQTRTETWTWAWDPDPHGIRQLRSGWADGPAYITQCPIQSGQSYVYNYTITGQRGTLFWHAHISWLRATVYGPIIILPTHNDSYPFPKPHKEVPIIFGEWWNADTETVISQALQTGAGPNVSDAYTINGLPGPLYNCSQKDTFRLKVKPGKTYLLRLINAALNDELFFSIANHTVTVVEADALYVKPFETDIILITPGQTTNLLLKTKPNSPPNHTKFLMLARPYSTGLGTFDNTTVAGILEYENPSNNHHHHQHQDSHNSNTTKQTVLLLRPTLPQINDTSFAANFSSKLRSLANSKYPANVPKTVDKRFFFTVGLGTNPCPKNQTCQGPTNQTKFAASVNNVSFTLPSTALLQAHFFGRSNGVYTTDFPSFPLKFFNFTGVSSNSTNITNVSNGTKVVVLPYNASVELVMQDTSLLGAESHPLHLHGFNFYVVGQGFGNYNSKTDPANFNLVDPVERNTIGVPSGGWVAIRFLADNPGVWFMHCHFEVHLSWGLRLAWIVQDGKLPNQKLLPPPSDLPKC